MDHTLLCHSCSRHHSACEALGNRPLSDFKGKKLASFDNWGDHNLPRVSTVEASTRLLSRFRAVSLRVTVMDQLIAF